MPVLSMDIKKLLTRTSLVVFPEDYVAVYLPIGVKAIPAEWFRPDTTRFAAVIQEPELITMILPRRKWLRMKNMFDTFDVSDSLKAITFDVKLSLVAGRFRVAIASALAEANINSIPISSFRRYHVVVPKADLPRTVKVLRNLIEGGSSKRPARAKR